MVDQGSCVWVKVPGTDGKVSLQIREGQPAAILGAFAADFNAYVEPLRDRDSACWTATNSVASSNHLSGTAMDLNWDGPDGKTFRFQIPEERAYPAPKAKAVRDLLEFYEDIVFCGGFWSIRDWMHFQMGANTYGSRNVEKVNDFIRRKIRPDGFSTFRRSTTPVIIPPPVVVPPVKPPNLTRAEGYALRIINEGRRRGITVKGIQIALATALVESNITVYANEKLPKSLALPHDAVGRDGLSVGIFQQQVKDTGNGWWWGDEKTCMGVESSAGLFYDRLVAQRIGKQDYNTDAVSPGHWAQMVQKSAYPDRYDERFGEAISLYNRLIGVTAPPPPNQGEDELSAEDSRKIDVIYQELTKRFPSRSPLRHVNEGLVDTFAGFLLNTDGHGHVQLVKLLASYGDPDALALLREVANNTLPDRQHDAQFAQAILAEATSTDKVDVVKTTPSYVQPVPVPQVFSAPAPAPVVEANTTGALIGRAYDALEALKNAQGALTPEARASVDSLINVLKTEEGSAS